MRRAKSEQNSMRCLWSKTRTWRRSQLQKPRYVSVLTILTTTPAVPSEEISTPRIKRGSSTSASGLGLFLFSIKLGVVVGPRLLNHDC